MEKSNILDNITKKYLSSEEFNGYPLREFEDETRLIVDLVKEGLVEINFGDRHPNPHIRAFSPEAKEIQLDKIRTNGITGACAYPTKEHLRQIVEPDDYSGRPFTLKLALGEPELDFAAFELSVLENYRNDPRYLYNTNSVSGTISISNTYYDSLDVKSSDKISISTFGFCYDKENRYVAVLYRYLANLSPEHQRIWETKMVTGNFWLHPDYAANVSGDWSEKASMFDAFSEELSVLNEYSKLMKRQPLFKDDFRTNKPREFSFLIRPTLREFNDFVHVLDKMISENINRDFFGDDVPLKTEMMRKDGKIEVSSKWTITILEEWLARVRFPEPDPKIQMIKTFRKIRKMRMKPAHSVEENVFDREYFKKHRELMIEAYGAIRTLRLIFANHRDTKTYVVPEWLYKGEIRTY